MRHLQRKRERMLPHITLFTGAVITGAGIASALIGWHFQGALQTAANELMFYGKVMVGSGTVLHVLAFFAYALD